MATESKKVVVKDQCIALKSDRTQCVRNVSENSQFCWQHQKSANKCGTVLAPAPIKPKSNRGRPKGSVNPRKNNVIITTATAASSNPIIRISNLGSDVTTNDLRDIFEKIGPVKNISLNSSFSDIEFNNALDAQKAYQEYNNAIINDKQISISFVTPVTPITTLSTISENTSDNNQIDVSKISKPIITSTAGSLISDPPTLIRKRTLDNNTYLTASLFQDININLEQLQAFPDTLAAVGPLSIEIPVGGETHINITKELKLPAGNFTVADICKNIKEFFNTKAVEDDIDLLLQKLEETPNDTLLEYYSEELENIVDSGLTYKDLQLNLLKIKSIVCRDSKYVCVMEDIQI